MTNVASNVTSKRTYELEGGNKIHAERRDPFGLIYLHGDKGALPEKLRDNAFTSYDDAEREIQRYINVKNKSVLKVAREG